MNRFYRKRRQNSGFYIGGFEITKREIIASISIISIMFVIGLSISSLISDYQMDRNEVYNKAVKIEDAELFQYGMGTNIGNAFVYGDLMAVDAVTYPEIGGSYMCVEKEKEVYTQHTRVVTYTDSDGKSKTRTETYWSWDFAGIEEIKSKNISFCGVTFDIGKIDIPNTRYITTINESGFVRYKYYGTDTEFSGTIFADLRDNTIPDNTSFYDGCNIEETVNSLQVESWVLVFWIFWVLLMAGAVVAFFSLENRWLE